MNLCVPKCAYCGGDLGSNSYSERFCSKQCMEKEAESDKQRDNPPRLFFMNSSMMPNPGHYELTKIDESRAKKIFKQWQFGTTRKVFWKSFIGYENTAKHLGEILGITIPLSREETMFCDSDEAIVCKLKYRPQNPGMKADKNAQAQVSPDDFELFHVVYRSK